MKIKGPEIKEPIENYEVVKKTSYLGITIGGRCSNIFQKENENITDKANKNVSTIMSEVQKSADKVLVGKAIWKLMAIPSILFGRAVVPSCKSKTEAIQRKENRVWRHLMGIGAFSAIDALRGEMGASMVKSRIMETVLQFARDALNSKFTNIKEMMEDTIKVKKGYWYRYADSYMKELGIKWKELQQYSREDLKKIIIDHDTKLWKESLEKKPTLKYYNKGKNKIGYEFCYRNNTNSKFLARARMNCLKLEEAKGRGNKKYDKTCKLCHQEEENLVHFIVGCKDLEADRNYCLINESIEDPEEKMIDLLFSNKEYQKVGKMIKKLWYRRRNILKFKKEKNMNEAKVKTNRNNIKSDPGPERKRQIPREREENTRCATCR